MEKWHKKGEIFLFISCAFLFINYMLEVDIRAYAFLSGSPCSVCGQDLKKLVLQRNSLSEVM